MTFIERSLASHKVTKLSKSICNFIQSSKSQNTEYNYKSSANKDHWQWQKTDFVIKKK